ncbi:hypothetical protein HMPREF9498_01173 [Enterococcus faecalis TX4248]|uniref:Uncharacterized protein n=1 Tax=Enterococcus faecalis TX4248 TaxID=749495 RepID=A0A125W7I8_ENTFL|nr:hypothetical protein HMPREF9498_01173 [Enterococcus faecalis TX4248]EFT48356.1 hypothetical protein HMPREF9501_00772 [Enterococcus faecalis TX0027]EFU00302.1 hypothetical protein HMPREF9503_01129 [Enterococcus faecalis TX0043]
MEIIQLSFHLEQQLIEKLLLFTLYLYQRIKMNCSILLKELLILSKNRL